MARIAVTADLHWGIRPAGDIATRSLVSFLTQNPPDLLLLGGDIGATKDFEPCLELFSSLPCKKAAVPGNHDVWVYTDDPRGDSLQVFQRWLPGLCKKHGFAYLDSGPLLLPECDLAIVGTMNWYDYSWSLEDLKKITTRYQEHLRQKRFTRAIHNDVRYVRWDGDDTQLTRKLLSAFETHLLDGLAQASKALVLTHHPAIRALCFPAPPEVQQLDALLWLAFSGNQGMEDLLTRHQDRIAFILSGHTHRRREEMLGPVNCINIGGDYHFKRLVMIDWPQGTVETHEFHPPES